MKTTEQYKYKAFISYSHAADGKLASALQSAVHSFTKPGSAVCMPKGVWICLIVSLLFVVFGSIANAISAAIAKDDDCDPSLEQPQENPYGYRLRGDRCEGMYVRQVGSTTLVVASLTEAFEDYDLTSDRDLIVQWTPLGNQDLRLRAHGLKRRLYYRMDTTQPVSTKLFKWPVGLLAALRIPRQDLGIAGSVQYSLGKMQREVYLPLRISQKKDPSRSGSYTLVLLPGVELSEVYVSLATVGSDGRPKTYVSEGDALKRNYYPAERPIDIPISSLPSNGYYYLEIGATLKNGGSDTVELWFHHQNP